MAAATDAHATDCSLTLFKNGKSLKTIQLEGKFPLVRFVNGDIISAARDGKLTILNKQLKVLKTIDGPAKYNGTWDSDIRTLAGNDKFIAFGDYDGSVRYYNRADGVVSKVRYNPNFIKLSKEVLPH